MAQSYISKHPARLSSDQFQTVGIFLLRHQTATRAVGVSQGNEAKLLTAIQYQVLCPSAQVCAQQRRPE